MKIFNKQKIGETIQIDSLIRSARRTISMQITADARLVVRAPGFASLEQIQKILKEKKAWIMKTQKMIKDRKVTFLPIKFIADDRLLYFGQYYQLKIVTNLSPIFYFDKHFYLEKSYSKIARDIITKWYIKQSGEYFQKRVSEFAAVFNFRFNKITISDAKTRWGSCNSDNNLTFSWRLLMAPKEISDYVIVHELMHIKHKNHSRSFWSAVAKVLPDYTSSKLWLKNNGFKLDFVDNISKGE